MAVREGWFSEQAEEHERTALLEATDSNRALVYAVLAVRQQVAELTEAIRAQR